MQIERTVYESTYERLHSVVRHKTVLELATGTGRIAENIVANAADSVETMDSSPEMITEAERDDRAAFLCGTCFSCPTRSVPLMWRSCSTPRILRQSRRKPLLRSERR